MRMAFILGLLISSLIQAATPSYFDKAKAFFDAGSMPSLSQLGSQVVWTGECVFPDKPNQLRSGELAIAVRGDEVVGLTSYFASWKERDPSELLHALGELVDEGIVTASKEDPQHRAISHLVTETPLSVEYLRTNKLNTGKTAYSVLSQCTDPNGCNDGISVGQPIGYCYFLNEF